MISSSSRKGSLTSRLTQAPSKFERIRVKVKFVRWLPKRVAGFAPFPGKIYINRRKFSHFDNMNLAFLGLLFHEAWHQVQMKEMGWFRWIRKYLFSRRIRLAIELQAHIFGDIQRFSEYPQARMEQWARVNIKSYFRYSGVPASSTIIEQFLVITWDRLKEIALILEYEL